jgi:hypothetical protein
MFSILFILSFIITVFANLRGIIKYDTELLTQKRIDNIILDIAKHNNWVIHICKNDMLYYEFCEEHIILIKNMFIDRSITYTEDGYCKFLYVEFQKSFL